MSDLRLRELTPEDWLLLRRMRMRAVEMHPDLFYDTMESASSHPPDHWQARLAKPGNKSYCLFDGDCCVGLSAIVEWGHDPSGQTGMMCSTFLEPAYRGKGLVNLFYDARLKHAIAYKSWQKLVTDHRIGNERSRKAILKHGFVLTDQVMIDFPNGDRDYELRYELDLEKLR